MALACWPSAADYDDLGRLRLAGAYWRRKRIEARLIAAELAQVLAGAQGRSQQQQRVSMADAAAQWFG